jgi:hypothetical protein
MSLLLLIAVSTQVCSSELGDFHSGGCVNNACTCTPSFTPSPCPINPGDTYQTVSCIGCYARQRRALRGVIEAAPDANGHYTAMPATDLWKILGSPVNIEHDI